MQSVRKYLLLVLLVALVLFFFGNRDQTPKQIQYHIKSSDGEFVAMLIETSFCLTCPDGELVFDIAREEENVIYLGPDWQEEDVANFIRALQPECEVVVANLDLPPFYHEYAEKRSYVYKMTIHSKSKSEAE